MTPTGVAEAKAKARDYFRARGTLVPVAEIRARLTDAFGSLDTLLTPISVEVAARTGIPGEWTIQEIVDHLVETHRPGLDELWCLLAGRRPPGEPIPASLQSKSARDRPWPWLRAELDRIHGEILRTLTAVPATFWSGACGALLWHVNQ